MGNAVVLDIEGTVCPISFVHDVLFPYALEKVRTDVPKLTFPLNSGHSDLEEYLTKFPNEYTANAKLLVGHIEDLVARDVKDSKLKALQGYLWRAGYESGEIKAPLFGDVSERLRQWHTNGTKIYIYSSGSVPAQQLLFKHTEEGDFTWLFTGYFDTVNAGPKMDSPSYDTIQKNIGLPASNLHFYSDNPKEIDAAHAAGWHTTFMVRPGNPDYSGYKAPDNSGSSLS